MHAIKKKKLVLSLNANRLQIITRIMKGKAQQIVNSSKFMKEFFWVIKVDKNSINKTDSIVTSKMDKIFSKQRIITLEQ
ncbi:hypothetical protein ASE92_12020 [Pedobacter sp. Leaf41]|nr:hypothetical protein ASE92_12020 [Pedobacter sp. Leaf41]